MISTNTDTAFVLVTLPQYEPPPGHALDGNWFAGLIAMQDQFGHARGALRIRTQDATRVPPELADATWEVWNDAEDLWIAAPQLRHAAVREDSPKAAHDEI